LALRDGREIDRVGHDPNAMVAPPMSVPGAHSQIAQDLALAQIQSEVDAVYPVYRQIGYWPQLVLGASYSHKYADNDTFTVGLEYFYNGYGYNDPNIYSGLLYPHSQTLENPASFFYLGKHYGGLF